MYFFMCVKCSCPPNYVFVCFVLFVWCCRFVCVCWVVRCCCLLVVVVDFICICIYIYIYTGITYFVCFLVFHCVHVAFMYVVDIGLI